MVTDRVRPYLYRLDEIYDKNRKRFAAHGAMIIFQTIQDFLRYWRELEDKHFASLQDWETDELYFFFNEKLLEIIRCHIDIYWLIMDYDDLPLYRDGRQPLPFWHKERRRAQKKRWNNRNRSAQKKN